MSLSYLILFLETLKCHWICSELTKVAFLGVWWKHFWPALKTTVACCWFPKRKGYLPPKNTNELQQRLQELCYNFCEIDTNSKEWQRVLLCAINYGSTADSRQLLTSSGGPLSCILRCNKMYIAFYLMHSNRSANIIILKVQITEYLVTGVWISDFPLLDFLIHVFKQG